MKPYFFLLGGHDLKMVTIRDLLEQHRIDFLDRNLAWGASWLNYQDITENFDWQQRQLVGIELSGIKPDKAQLIDHHADLSHLPAATEQVADLLHIPLSRHQLLVAANDKGYIPAMQKMGATNEEIAQIRRLDRQAQGITAEMEVQAEHGVAAGHYAPEMIEQLTDKICNQPIMSLLRSSEMGIVF